MTKLKSKDETELISRMVQGDQAALSQLYDRYARVMYSLAFKMLGSAEESEEVVLDVFAKAWRTAARYDASRSRVDSWLFLMTRSRSLDRLRQRQRQTKVVEAATNTAQVSSPDVPDDALIIAVRISSRLPPPVDKSIRVSAPYLTARLSLATSSLISEELGEAPILAFTLQLEAIPIHIGSRQV